MSVRGLIWWCDGKEGKGKDGTGVENRTDLDCGEFFLHLEALLSLLLSLLLPLLPLPLFSLIIFLARNSHPFPLPLALILPRAQFLPFQPHSLLLLYSLLSPLLSLCGSLFSFAGGRFGESELTT